MQQFERTNDPAGTGWRMNDPLVSVIVGVYNKAQYLVECLRSVLAQTYRKWELIVVDDASTDGSWEIVREIAKSDSRIRIMRRDCNSGGCGIPRNDGARLSRGGILMFLDADDAWCRHKMESQVKYMEAHPEYLFCHTQCQKIDGAGQILQIRHPDGLPASGPYRRALLDRMWISISTIAVRRGLWDKVGPFIEDQAWGGEEDLEFSLRCARLTDFGVIQEPLAQYRVSGNNWTSKKWKGVERDYVAYCRVYGRRELWDGVKSAREMRQLLADMAVEGCQYWRARGQRERATWFALQAMRWEPFSILPWRQAAGVLLGRR